jgi:homoserine O-succinyltransferase
VSAPRLRIGLVNLMPDAALVAAERQFARLLGARAPGPELVLTTLAALPRGPQARDHIDRNYGRLADVRDRGLDGLIITGTNVTGEDLTGEPFWEPLLEAADWGLRHARATLLSCLATHVVLHGRFGQPRRRLAAKCWGVFPHEVARDVPGPAGALVRGLDASVPVPHSRWNEVTAAQFAAAGLRVLVASPRAGVHLAAADDGRLTCLQGHPEYDAISLLKEFKRDACLFAEGALATFPPYPAGYLPPLAQAILEDWRHRGLAAAAAGRPWPEFPEPAVAPLVPDPWRGAAEVVFRNWMAGLGA